MRGLVGHLGRVEPLVAAGRVLEGLDALGGLCFRGGAGSKAKQVAGVVLLHSD